jgi:phosphatidylinositol-3-phosphatase
MRYRVIIACTALMAAVFLILALQPASASFNRNYIAPKKTDRVFIIMMENQSFDEVIGRSLNNNAPPAQPLATPYITYLARSFGLATLYFGTTHPSLPNYLSTIGGDYYGVQDDNDSCAAVPAETPPACHPLIKTKNVVDTLEASGRTWLAFEQSMPSVGFLGSRWPAAGPNKLYAMKHNPFVYYQDIVSNPSRMAKILPYNSAGDIAKYLTNAKTAPQYVYIVPDQCHDMHGTGPCNGDPSTAQPDPLYNALLQEGDGAVRSLVQTITSSAAFTPNSLIIITWDEDDYFSSIGCCLSPSTGGGHVATIVISGRSTGPLRSATPYNHYSMLKTVETGFGLSPLLGNTASPLINPLWDLVP